ncbi:hypothetical protein M422DRAFT_63138 [Sphaerobolus stellatus SS14]|nr:hypothetical protein M422DRAFT_63138 [Sphaerobolus stellatus SS14]
MCYFLKTVADDHILGGNETLRLRLVRVHRVYGELLPVGLLLRTDSVWHIQSLCFKLAIQSMYVRVLHKAWHSPVLQVDMTRITNAFVFYRSRGSPLLMDWQLLISLVQISKNNAANNSARLQLLAYKIGDRLVKVSDYMEGKWDNLPEKLAIAIDDPEAFLERLLKDARTFRIDGLLGTFKARGKEQALIRWENKFKEIESTFSISKSFLTPDTSCRLAEVGRAVTAQASATEEIHQALHFLKDNYLVSEKQTYSLCCVYLEGRRNSTENTGVHL